MPPSGVGVRQDRAFTLGTNSCGLTPKVDLDAREVMSQLCASDGAVLQGTPYLGEVDGAPHWSSDPDEVVTWSHKKGLNRGIYRSGWASVVRMLQYKCVLAGVPFIRVPAAYTSQCCSGCGHTCRENRESQAVFLCKECGFTCSADVNAARNILTRGLLLRQQWTTGLDGPEDVGAGVRPGAAQAALGAGVEPSTSELAVA